MVLEPDPDNGRVKRARLTEEGDAFVGRHLVALDEAEKAVWEALPAADRTMLNRVMGRYLAALAPSLASLNR